MRPILLVRNHGSDTFGLAEEALAAAGADLRVLEAIDPDARWPTIDDVGGIVMFGGTLNVDEVDEGPFLKQDRDIAREAVERGVPYLGSCLGAQLLARAMDGSVARAPVKEIGYEPVRPTASAARDRLLSHYADGDMVFHWHQDTPELPKGAELLAVGDRIHTQAFRVGELAWGLQFHFEIDAAEVDAWLDEASAVEDLRTTWGKSPDEVRAEAERFQAEHERKGGEVFRRFAELVIELERTHS
jgi:GMP synthase (glutamine-hydrolysing)